VSGDVTRVEIRFPEAMETSLITLYGIATDARIEPTILGDRMAAEAFEKIDYDFSWLTRFSSRKSVRTEVALHAKHFDAWTAEFRADHERATVLVLGAGLDTHNRLAVRTSKTGRFGPSLMRWGDRGRARARAIEPKLR
jgi:O-methyltransferase involved in polyketide biosynthesis